MTTTTPHSVTDDNGNIINATDGDSQSQNCKQFFLFFCWHLHKKSVVPNIFFKKLYVAQMCKRCFATKTRTRTNTKTQQIQEMECIHGFGF